MNDGDSILRKREMQKDVYGTHGFKFGPVMVSTNSKILFGLLRVLAGIGIFAFAIWLVLSTAVFPVPSQWFAAGIMTLIGIWMINVVLIEVYGAGVRSGLHHAYQSRQTNEEIEK